MKNFIKKATEIPIQITLAAIATIIMSIILLVSGQVSIAGIGLLLIIGAGIVLQIHYGKVVIRRVLSVLAVIYLASFYTYFVSAFFDYITQPFLLTLAGVSSFLSFTYSQSFTYDFRSRKLWGTILAFILVAAKMTTIISGYGFWVAELIGLNIIVMYTVIWRLWVQSSKKTKIIEPKIIKEKNDENYRYIHIENKLNAKENEWLGVDFRKNRNAYPYIYSEVMKAKEKELTLIIVSQSTTSEIYDKEIIEINKAKSIPYFYIEAQEDTYLEEILKDIEKERTL